MMGGIPRPIIAAIIVIFGAYTLWRRWRSGWALDSSLAEAHVLTER
jgi:hypothetical protein